MKKNIASVGISLILALLMAVLSPMQVFAASNRQYISDMRMSDSVEKLEALGYTVLDQDLNAGGNEGFTYIGYKTTTDPTEAITDISIMDMKGGYSFSDYNEMIQRQKDALAQQVEEYKLAFKELRTKYEAGSPAAIRAVAALNMFKEDDSGKLIGDMYLDPNLSSDDLIKIFMQGSVLANGIIDMSIAVGLADYGEDNWLQRLSDHQTTDENYYELSEQFLAVYDNIRTLLTEYTENDVSFVDDPEGFEAYFQELSDDEKQEYLNRSMVYETLQKYTYGNGTLVDFFMQEDIEAEALYPLIDVLTDGQRAIAKQIGLVMMILTINNSESVWAEADEAMALVRDTVENKEAISVYIGTDRSFYAGGVAMTSDAKRKSASTGDNSALYGNVDRDIETTLSVLFGLALVGVVMSSVAVACTGFTVPLVVTAAWSSLGYGSASSLLAAKGLTVKEGIYFGMVQGGGITAAGIALLATVAILLVIAGVYIGLELYNYYHPTYSEIPLILMDLKFGEDDEIGDWEEYVRYDVVRDENGNAADLNQFSGKQWNAMYVTKDKCAGDPITADSLMVKYGESATPRGCYSVHYFGTVDAFDLNSHCYNNDVDGIFAFFQRDSSAFATEAASVFSGGALAVVTGFGGLLLGTFCGLIIMRKKKVSAEEMA